MGLEEAMALSKVFQRPASRVYAAIHLSQLPW
jgi:hypothetical protein